MVPRQDARLPPWPDPRAGYRAPVRAARSRERADAEQRPRAVDAANAAVAAWILTLFMRRTALTQVLVPVHTVLFKLSSASS